MTTNDECSATSAQRRSLKEPLRPSQGTRWRAGAYLNRPVSSPARRRSPVRQRTRRERIRSTAAHDTDCATAAVGVSLGDVANIGITGVDRIDVISDVVLVHRRSETFPGPSTSRAVVDTRGRA